MLLVYFCRFVARLAEQGHSLFVACCAISGRLSECARGLVSGFGERWGCFRA